MEARPPERRLPRIVRVRAVLATSQLGGFGGSETYLLTVAEQLERLGHPVTVWSPNPGPAADFAQRQGLLVAAGEADLPRDCDALLVQDLVVSAMLAERYPNVGQLFVAHSAHFDAQLPAQLPGAVQAVVTLSDHMARRARALSVPVRTERLRQPVDLELFRPLTAIQPRAERVLIAGSYFAGERLELLLDACARAGLQVERFGGGAHAPGDLIAALSRADIVVGKARVIVEAMASGRAAYVYDRDGADGWVTP